MDISQTQMTPTEKMAHELSSFALDRTDLKELMDSIPEKSALNLTAIEYELSILKILSTGWGISFYMPASDPGKTALTDAFWRFIHEISQSISTLAQTTTGQAIDYFDILKKRLDVYVMEMQNNQTPGSDPTAIMGPAFARICGCPDDAVAILVGTKMFALTLGAVKEYLDSIRGIPSMNLN